MVLTCKMCIRDRHLPDDKSNFTPECLGIGYQRISCAFSVSYTHLDVYKRQDEIHLFHAGGANQQILCRQWVYVKEGHGKQADCQKLSLIHI